ncbi:MAG: leucyl/phenylalanyl-tRNA--protein transferase [Litorimonas sp.]
MTQSFGTKELIDCYRRGIFPMSDGRHDDSIFLLDPAMRGIIPLDGLHISKSLAKFIRKANYEITFDTAFSRIIEACALTRDDTWISESIEYLYTDLFHQGNAHSVEVWKAGELIGGLYGVTQGGAFFGESMFSLRDNASKIALIGLVERLNTRGFTLLDTQFITDHLKTLGAIEITQSDYKARLACALEVDAIFYP